MSTDKQKETSELRNRVQETREQAREILRAKAINNLLQDLFHDNKALEETQKNLESNKKRLAVCEYDLKKLDTDRPDAEDKKKEFEECVACRKKAIENCEKEVAEKQKQVDATNAAIAKVETGETKMNIDEIKELADELLGV